VKWTNFGLVLISLSHRVCLLSMMIRKSISNGNNVMYYAWSPASTYCETEFEVWTCIYAHDFQKDQLMKITTFDWFMWRAFNSLSLCAIQFFRLMVYVWNVVCLAILPSWCFPFCQVQIAKRKAPINCTSLSFFINILHVYGCFSYCPTIFCNIIDCPMPKIYSLLHLQLIHWP
jgi:hypothetical protein